MEIFRGMKTTKPDGRQWNKIINLVLSYTGLIKHFIYTMLSTQLRQPPPRTFWYLYAPHMTSYVPTPEYKCIVNSFQVSKNPSLWPPSKILIYPISIYTSSNTHMASVYIIHITPRTQSLHNCFQMPLIKSTLLPLLSNHIAPFNLLQKIPFQILRLKPIPYRISTQEN